MNEKLLEYQQKIDGLNQRERVLVFLIALVAVVMLLQIFVIDPLLKQQSIGQTEIAQLTKNISQKKNIQVLLDAEIQAGVNRKKIKERDELLDELSALDKKVGDSIVTMIPPRLMPQVLEQILSSSNQLKLLSIENKQVVSIVEQAEQMSMDDGAGMMKAKSDDAQALYRHGFVLKLQGGYLAAIDYFNKLSDLPWRFHWDDLHYEVADYPNAIITLEVHTVSMSKEWIGV